MIINENDNFVKISNKYIRDLKDTNDMLNQNELIMLTLIKINKTIKGTYIFTLNWLMKILNYADKNTRKLKEMKEILQNFIDVDMIQVYKTIVMEEENLVKDISLFDKNDLIYCEIVDDTDIDDKEFTIIYDKEIFKIIEISKKHNIDIYNLLNFVLYIYSLLDNNEGQDEYRLCYPSFSKIYETISLSETTIEKYIAILKKYEIIEADYAGYKETSNGKIKNGKMFYCRYMDRDILIDRINKERKEFGFIKLNNLSKDKRNLKISLTQQINNIKKLEEKGLTNDLDIKRLNILIEERSNLDNKEEQEKREG